MNRLSAIVVFLALLGDTPTLALKEITADFDSGEVAERVEKSYSEDKATFSKKPEEEVEIRRLKKIIRAQQEMLRRQQAVIEEQRKEIRRQERLNRGLEMLRRSGQ